ncbi:serine protease Do [Paenibacillus sp. SORGH_AS306]|uniref:S1C family serine protease n=1 Tax=unclassified Paenibacillus TaxID=185978 RepID=UPI00278B4F05|nr:MULTISPECIES: trypsin-like peptidase domain-containing protein [unclassified Paenibacillus]MDQ1235494.1 serine protease Do [Paenibacillus sp. SORGH_AS_0306]MDR6112543.1 serine protease Do [Paenibacillus sp. SORGH_AS_0338]
MNKAWIVSSITSVVIVAAGIGSFMYINRTVPAQLPNKPLVATVTTKATQASKGNPALKDVIFNTQKKVVMIELDDGSLGSGFLYNKQGDIITNAHVVAGALNVKVKTADARTLDGKVIGIGTDMDIAVVRVPELADTEPLSLAQNSNADVGDNVLALGSPLGLQNTITTGIISGVGRDFTIDPYVYTNLYQISAPIAPGNSGGPLIHADTGEVLGINSAMASESNTIGFSIPVSEIQETVQKWSKNPGKDLPKTSKPATDTVSDAPSVQDDAQYIVSYFYESLSMQDYVTAYSLLGSRWQSNLSYADFRQGYIQTGEVSIDSIIASKDGDQVKVTVEITAEERKDTGTVYSSYKLDYVLGYENDILKILSGEGKKLTS